MQGVSAPLDYGHDQPCDHDSQPQARWDAGLASRRDGQLLDDAPMTSAELVQSPIRVNLVLELLAESPIRQLTLALDMATNMRSLASTVAI